MAEPTPPRLSDIEAALRLFDETTGALSAQVRRLEVLLTQKQQEVLETNTRLEEKVGELDRLTAWLNLVMSAVASGVVAVDLDGCITTCNDAAISVLMAFFDDPIGANYRALFPDSPLSAVLATGKTMPAYEHRVQASDGSLRVLSAKATPLRAADGTLLGAVEVFEDVTEVRRLQEQVERADRLKQLGEMAAGVAHEIRNPLTGIEGFASLLARDLPADDPRHRYAEAIGAGVRDLNHIVTGLLEFTKPRRLDRRPVDPVTLAENCVELVRAERLERHERSARSEAAPTVIVLRVRSRWPGGTVALDGIQVRQVLLNLIQNAVHAVDEAATDTDTDTETKARPAGLVEVTVTALGEGAGVAFIVDDNGPGVRREDRQRIFTPFFTTRDHGTGLGLAVSYTVVQLHGGSLSVDDGPLGGARFRAAIPAG